jgi:uncharacterized protein involved in exopolysaccharide biosynthesis
MSTGTALLVTRLTAPVYEAVATVGVGFSAMTSDAFAAAAGRAIDLIRERANIAQVIGEFGLDRPPHNFTPSDLLLTHVRAQVIGTSMVGVYVRLPDPGTAAKVANRLVERAIDVNAHRYYDRLVQQVTRAEHERNDEFTRLGDIQRRLAEARAGAETALISELELLRTGLRTPTSSLAPLLIEIELVKADLGRAEAAITRRFPRGVRDDDLSDPDYRRLQATASETRSKLIGLEKTRDDLIAKEKLQGLRSTALADIYLLQVQVRALETEYLSKHAEYEMAANRYEQIRRDAATVDINLIDRATPPERPLSPRSGRDAATGFLLGLITSSILAFLIHFLRVRQSVHSL